MPRATKKSEENTEEQQTNLIYDHIAEYIVQKFIKEDVNAFTESTLMHELLAYKLKEIGKPLMMDVIASVASELKAKKQLDLKKKVGGITQVKKISFRSDDQYNAFVSLFFEAIEERPEEIDFIKKEQDFENFMLYCINDFRELWDQFVAKIVEDRLAIERQKGLHAYRSSKTEVLQEVPTYADFIAERIDKVKVQA
ncbi:hypothetical protein [Methanocella arvoryzae]|uniref:hypothetical protein n=1 Tax=Methanocella arvoryzae TaxID=1175445 RepID=UPI00032339BC|nr:hypothetical protein [Methanocella arvoryzae]